MFFTVVLFLFLLAPSGYRAVITTSETPTGAGKEDLASPEVPEPEPEASGSGTEIQDFGTLTINPPVPSGKTSVLWTNEQLKTFTYPEIKQNIQNISKSTKVDDIFTSLYQIGKGAFGTVVKGKNKTTNEDVALKKIIVTEPHGLRVLAEIIVSMKCQDLNIVRFIDAFSELNGKKFTVVLVMEYMSGGTLASLLGKANYASEELRMTEVQIATVCLQILKALKCLHDNGVLHGDLKPLNILFSGDGKLKLCDFGCVKNSHEENNDVIGSPYWRAPEVVQLLGYNAKADVWSFGIIIIEMTAGCPPHHDLINDSAVTYKIGKEAAPTVKSSDASSEMLAFANPCLNKDPSQRPSVQELLKHPFLSKAKGPGVLCPLIEARQARLRGSSSGPSLVPLVQTAGVPVTVC